MVKKASLPPNVGISQLKMLGRNISKAVLAARETGNAPNNRKSVQRIFSVNEAEALVGRDRTTLNRLGKEGAIPPRRTFEFPPAEEGGKSIRRTGYNIDDIFSMREYFKVQRLRDVNTDPAVVIGVQSFKGGSGKSTFSTNLTHYFATQNNRVLIVDLDPQASTSVLHDRTLEPFLSKGDEVEFEESMADILAGTLPPEDIRKLVKRTYWPNVDIIPGGMVLFGGEMQAYADIASGRQSARDVFLRFREALDIVKQDYDLVILDTQPGLGALGINAFCAADAVFVPSPPRMLDLGSTGYFFMMWATYLEQVWPDKHYAFVKVVPTMFEPNRREQHEVLDVMEQCIGKYILRKQMLLKRDIQRSSNLLKTPYEDPESPKDVLDMLNSLCETCEKEVWKLWPSKNKVMERLAEVV